MPQAYSKLQILLHWVIVVLVAIQYVFHEAIVDAYDAIERGVTQDPTLMVRSHVIGGLLILVLMALRIFLRWTKGAPDLPEEEHPLLKLAAKATHGLFYLLLVLLPVSGAVAWFGMVEPAAEAHEIMRAVLMLLILLHIAAALMHQFYLKTDLMKRMSFRG